MIHFCILFSFFLVLLFLKVYVNSFKDHVWQPRRSNPRFSVADAKVPRVFGIAKPIHYFFWKKFQIRDFLGENDGNLWRKTRNYWEKDEKMWLDWSGGAEVAIDEYRKTKERNGGIEIPFYIDWYPLLYIGVVGGCSWWVDRFYQECSYFSSLEKGVNWESRRR